MYVIDGYNLMHALRRVLDLPPEHERARARCVELLALIARRENQPMRIFFDGTPGNVGRGDHAFHGVRVTFCGHEPESADRAVREYVANHAEPRKLMVVSSDNAVRDACRLSGARVISSQEVADKLARRHNERAPEPEVNEKPARGHIGDIEREMLDDIGDFEDFEREVLNGD